MTDKNSPPVGFGNPPVHSRFKPGVSGNPAGRPKKLPTLWSEVLAELGKVATCDGEELSNAAKIAKFLVKAAGGGSMRAIAELLAFCAKQPADVDIGDGPTVVDAEILQDYIDREVRRRSQESESEDEPIADLGKEETQS